MARAAGEADLTTQTWTILIVELALLALDDEEVIWMIVDVRRFTEVELGTVGQQRSLWKVLSIVGLVAFGWIRALVYHLVAHRQLVARRTFPGFPRGGPLPDRPHRLASVAACHRRRPSAPPPRTTCRPSWTSTTR